MSSAADWTAYVGLNATKIIAKALRSILRPVAKFCIRRSIKFQEFSEIAKAAFVDAAHEELQDDDGPSTSKLSVITGLQRRDIERLRAAPEDLSPEKNIITRLVGHWSTQKRFVDAKGKAKKLTIAGVQSEFAQLVHSLSKDLNHHTVLFELERLRLAHRERNRAVLDFPAHISTRELDAGLTVLSADVSELIAAVDENLFDQVHPPNLHARTSYDNICVEFVPEIRTWLLRFGRKIHDEARRYLSKFDKDINTKLKDKPGGVKVVLGTFGRDNATGRQAKRAELKDK